MSAAPDNEPAAKPADPGSSVPAPTPDQPASTAPVQAVPPSAPAAPPASPPVPVPAASKALATPPAARANGPAIHQHPLFTAWAVPLLILVFTIISIDYLRGDIWLDESLTLSDYAFRRRLSSVLLSYKAANNHILYSVMLWCWRLLIGNGNELTMRLPGLVMAILTLLLCYGHGRRLFDRTAGFLLAGLLAFSPVYLGFFWQIRGYGLSILLATLATLGSLYLTRGDWWRGLSLYLPGVLLLPGVIPSNLMVNFSLWLFLLLVWWRQRLFRRRFWALLGLGLAGVLGMALYLPIWSKFRTVMAITDGWHNGPLVLGHLLLAALAHGGLFMLATLGLRRQSPAPRTDGPPTIQGVLPWLALACALPVAVVVLVSAPFPRVFLAYLPALTCIALYGYHPGLFRRNLHFYLMLFFLLANSLIWQRLSDYDTKEAMRAGQYPQDLLRQFYARQQDLSSTLIYLRDSPLVAPHLSVFADYRLYHPLEAYWLGFGGQLSQVDCLDGGEQFPLKHPKSAYPWRPTLVLAYHGPTALSYYRAATGLDTAEFEALPSPTALTIYRVILPRPDPPSRLMPAPPPRPLGPAMGGARAIFTTKTPRATRASIAADGVATEGTKDTKDTKDTKLATSI